VQPAYGVCSASLSRAASVRSVDRSAHGVAASVRRARTLWTPRRESHRRKTTQRPRDPKTQIADLLGQHRNAGTDPLLLPRIRFKQRLNRYDRRTPSVTRLQFPVALAYAMTYNRAQGATLAKVGIDVREPSFMHGHTYVAFSRAQSRDAVVVLTSPGVHSVVNVVYAEILKHLGQDAEHRRKSIQSMAAARVAAQAHRASNVS
jgi:hypothetical protein